MLCRFRFVTVIFILLLMFNFPSLQAEILAVTYNGDVIGIDETSGDNSLIGYSGFDRLNALTRDASGRFYASTSDGTIISINEDTGAGTFVYSIPMPSPVHILRALAVSDTGEFYWASGSLYEVSPDTLEKYDPETGLVTAIAIIENSEGIAVTGLTGLTFSSDGRLMGWDQLNFGLIEIDPATAVMSRVGPNRGWPTVNIETLAYDLEGALVGIGGYARDGSDNLYEFNASGQPLSHVRIGALDIRGMEYNTDDPDDEEPDPEDPPPFQYPERRHPVEPEIIHNLYLIDCGPCPHCFERPCDPRVHPKQDSFLIWDPLHDQVAKFSRKSLGLTAKDGPINAAAPLQTFRNKNVYVISLPYADTRASQTGSVVFFDQRGKIIKRIDGRRKGEHFGLVMDVWSDEVAIASNDRLIRMRRGKIIFERPWSQKMQAQRGIRIAFTRDMDGDQRPEIMYGAPYARIDKVENAGMIQVIGSHKGKVLDTQYGRYVGQRLGLKLQPIKQENKQ